jgi:hypothetical protein
MKELDVHSKLTNEEKTEIQVKKKQENGIDNAVDNLNNEPPQETFEDYLKGNIYKETRSFTEEDWKADMWEKWNDLVNSKEKPKQETNMSNITANQLIKDWKKTLESEWIQLDNLDEAKLVFDENGDVVVENEHGTQFHVRYLSDAELDTFYTNLI